MKHILIVAGESSADRYGARLVKRIRETHRGDEIRFYGTGGDAMRNAGVDIVTHVRELASIGPREAIPRFRKYYETFRRLARSLEESPPSIAILLDFPEFNLRLAKEVKRSGSRVVYYISPQVWAWRSGRVRIIRRYVDRMLVILPFEEEFYRRRGVEAEFVGHPLLEDFSPCRDRERFLGNLHLDPHRKTVALLPGSRDREVHYMLPTLIRAALMVLHKSPAQFVVSAAPSVDLSLVRSISTKCLSGSAQSLHFKIASCEARDLLANSDFALVKSGTSTLEAALVGIPFVIFYRISSLSWHLGNILIRSPYKGLVNLIAGEQIVPEFFQEEATPEKLAAATLRYLENPALADGMRERLGGIRARLSAKRASEAAAQAVTSLLG